MGGTSRKIAESLCEFRAGPLAAISSTARGVLVRAGEEQTMQGYQRVVNL